MSLFRSEEHVDRWLETTGYRKGRVVGIDDVWRLAKEWYRDPREPDWRARAPEQSQEVLAHAGLTDSFWDL